MKGLEGGRTPSGRYTTKHVPPIAGETMAEGQFNLYYILGIYRSCGVLYHCDPV